MRDVKTTNAGIQTLIVEASSSARQWNVSQCPQRQIVPLFPVPNFPSYPSNHSTTSAARSEVLAYLFPTRAEFIRAVGKEAGDSRIWAGIHYQMDNVAGVQLGRSVAQVFIARAQSDGSQ